MRGLIGFISALMTKLCNRYLPDPLIFAILLTLIVFVSGLCIVEVAEGQSRVLALVGFWGDGFWNLLAFTAQMAMAVITGSALASSDAIKKLLKNLAALAKTPKQAVAMVCFFGGLASIIHWAFGLVVGALFAKQMARNLKSVDYGLLVACAYIGFMTFEGGFSGSILLSAATEGNAIVNAYLDGKPIPITETLFTKYNAFVLAGLLICMPIVVVYMLPKNPTIVDSNILEEEPSYQKILNKDASPALKLEESKILALLVVALGVVYLAHVFMHKGFAGLDLNTVNLIFLLAGLLLHKTPMAYMRAIQAATRSIAGILVQFPFYAAIALMIQSSGLVGIITAFFIDIATVKTYPLYVFLSSAVINFAIPSGGGHWVVQGPFVLEAAKELGADLGKATMAIAYGDVWGNLAQPFWALPALAVAGIGVREIMGYCITAMIFSAPIFMIGLYVF